jgi:hypothetical protein
MDCRESRELLQDELDGRLDAAAAARLAEHVASCAACADEKRGLASLRATFRAMPRPSAPVGLKGGVMSSLPKGRVRNLPRVLGFLVAAAAVVVVCVTLIPRSGGDGTAEREVAASSQVAQHARVSKKRAAETAPDEVLVPDAEKARTDEDAEADAKTADASKSAAPAKPPAPTPPPAAKPPRAEPSAWKKADEVAAPAVRYVVFRDAAAAERFAKELAAGDGWKSKDKDVEPGFVGGTGVARGDADDARRRDALADLSKEAARATRRVVARTSVAAADVDTVLAVEATRAGGSLVSRAETPKFAAVVEPPAPSAFAARAPETKSDAGDDARKAEEKSKASGALALTADKPAPPRVVVVIVVLEPPAPTSPR